MIKIKDAGNGYRIRISCDENGIKVGSTPSFNEKSPLWDESEEWLKDNEILPQYTDEEFEKKEASDKVKALDSQKQTCISLLDEIVHKFLSNYRKPDDVPEWQIYQDKLIVILESSEVQEIPEKPFRK